MKDIQIRREFNLEEKTAVYTFKTKEGQIRKALDLLALNNFIDSRLVQANPILNPELNKVTIEEYRGSIAWSILMELNMQVKRDLGLIEEKSEEPEMPEEPAEEPPAAPRPVSKPAPKPAAVKAPKDEVEEMLTQPADDDDIVVLE